MNLEKRSHEDAHFQTFYCGSAIASPSALTEMIKGMTLDEGAEGLQQDIADFLDGLPEKMHCSAMAASAVARGYHRGERRKDDHEEGALVCVCRGRGDDRRWICANNLHTVEEVTFYTKAGGGCAACHEGIDEILPYGKADSSGRWRRRRRWPCPGHAGSACRRPRSCPSWKNQKDRRSVEPVCPMLQRDHGDVELAECRAENAAPLAAPAQADDGSATLGGIQQR